MARAKNTERAAARRRNRAARSAALTGTIVTGDEEALTPPAAEPVPEPRRGFRMPNVREDIRALPGMFRTRRALWIPVIALVVAWLLAVGMSFGYVPPEIGQLAVSLVLAPTALFPFFIGGFLAPRASYLVGFVLGLLDGVLVSSWVAIQPGGLSGADAAAGAAGYVQLFAIALVAGTLAAAFAAWYRDFLRQSQERARANRLAREQKKRMEEKEAAREARRSSTRRTTTT